MNVQDDLANTSPAASGVAEPETTHDDPSRPPERADARNWKWLEASPGKLAAAAMFGIAFGFLLQKGGAAKFDILIGVLLLENFVVVKIMLTAIVVGMVGVYFLRRAGLVQQQINETKYPAQIVGGIIFGIGFGLLAYCPGTAAAAVGQGNLDAIVGILGLLIGSYAFALFSRFTSGKFGQLGNAGKLTLPELLHVPTGLFVAIAAPLMIGVLVLLKYFAP